MQSRVPPKVVLREFKVQSRKLDEMLAFKRVKTDRSVSRYTSESYSPAVSVSLKNILFLPLK